MSLNVNFSYNQTIPNVNVNGITVANSKITNETITVGTFGSLIANSFSAIGNSNTIGTLFTTGGNVGIGTTSPSQLLTVNGSAAITTLFGNNTLQGINDTIYLGSIGNGSQANFFLDRQHPTGSAFVIGYNTPKSDNGVEPFHVYGGGAYMFGCVSTGVSGGNNSVKVGCGFSNIPSFCYNLTSITANQNATLLTGGNIQVDNKSGFNASTGQYVIPVTGYYQVSYFVRAPDGTSTLFVGLGPAGSYSANSMTLGADPSNRRCISYSNILYYTAGTSICLLNDYLSSTFLLGKFSLYLVTIS